MLENKFTYQFLLYLIIFLSSTKSHAQESDTSLLKNKPREYSLVAYIGGGLGYYASGGGTTTSIKTTITHINPFSTVRVLWHPDHFLRFGIETGHMTFYSYTLQDTVGKVSLNAIPLLVEWAMPITKRISVFAGTGVYFLKSKLDFFDGKAISDKASLGWLAAVSYTQPLSKTLGVATEFKWMDASETANATACVQVQLVWKFLNW